MRAVLVCVVLCMAVVVGCYVAVAKEAASVDKPMPQIVTIIVCKVKVGGPNDQNAASTGSQNLEWDLDDGKFHCREVPTEVQSAAEAQGQEAPAWDMYQCQRAGMTLGPQWDASNSSSHYRFRWAVCPTPIHASKDPSSAIVGWVSIPPCPYEDGKVVCDSTSEI